MGVRLVFWGDGTKRELKRARFAVLSTTLSIVSTKSGEWKLSLETFDTDF